MALIIGTNGNDLKTGTSSGDHILGLGGNDSLFGQGGNDLINAGAGNDLVHAGTGDDLVIGGGGNDLLLGLAGADELKGEAGNDRIQGGTGADKLYGGDGDDVIHGFIQDLNGVAGDEFSKDGIDVISGGNGHDWIAGGWGNDRLYGGTGHDQLLGGFGNDYLNGGSGHDVVNGGDGNDRIELGSGFDTIVFDGIDYGGFNDEARAELVSPDDDLVVDFIRGQDKIQVMTFSQDDGLSGVVNKTIGFAQLDSNKDGKLTGADKYVDQKNVTVNGETEASLVIRAGDASGFSAYKGDDLTLFDVTRLYAGDFV